MQGDLLDNTFPEMNYEVFDVVKKKTWNEQNKMFDENVISCRTVGKNSKRIPCGRDTGECTQPPWEVCPNKCPNAIHRPA